MPLLRGGASDFTANVRAGAETNAAVSSASSVAAGGPAPKKSSSGGGRQVSAGAGAISTQSATAKSSGLQPAFAKATTTVVSIPKLWTPALSGAKIWYDANDPSDTTILPTDGSSLLLWKNKMKISSTDAVGVQYNTGVPFPTFNKNIQNGMPGVKLNSDAGSVPHGWFTITTPPTYFPNNFHWMCVYKGSGTTKVTYNTPLTRTNVGAYTGSIEQYRNTRLRYDTPANSSATSTWDHSDIAPNGPVNNTTLFGQSISSPLGDALVTDGVYTEYINATPVTLSTTWRWNDSGQTNMNIGSRGDRGTNSTLYFFEILIFNTAVTTDVRQKAEGYLAWKWGLVSKLPANHPYKAYAPVT